VTQELVVYSDDEMRDNIDTIKKNNENLIDTNKWFGLEVNVEKTKYILLAHHKNAGKKCIKIAIRSLENVIQFKCMVTTVTNQNLIQKKNKRSNTELVDFSYAV
jgi:hypothetical protein